MKKFKKLSLLDCLRSGRPHTYQLNKMVKAVKKRIRKNQKRFRKIAFECDLN